jgi:hypothetical protein
MRRLWRFCLNVTGVTPAERPYVEIGLALAAERRCPRRWAVLRSAPHMTSMATSSQPPSTLLPHTVRPCSFPLGEALDGYAEVGHGAETCDARAHRRRR